MSEPFLAEIRIVGFNFAPRGWAFCDGQILPINQNQSLYSLLGTTYGGDGRTSFALPDLRGRTPFHVGTGFTLGSRSGEETHALTTAETPAHTHTLAVSNLPANTGDPSGAAFAAADGETAYASIGSGQMAGSAVASVGGGQAHENMQPYIAVNFAIALRGLFPSRN